MIGCPVHQLPTKSSQIYQQASAMNVCTFTYAHLALLVSVSGAIGRSPVVGLLCDIFKSVTALNPSKSSSDYWQAINGTMLRSSKAVADQWQVEKMASVESLVIAKENALTYLANERARIMAMSHEQALTALVRALKIQDRIKKIEAISTNGIMENVLTHSVGAFNEEAFLKYEKSPDNVLHCGFAAGEAGVHPTQKPVRLMQALIELTTQEGQVVFDPFCGSGSTLVAAKLLGRTYLGFEINPAFAAIAEDRLGLGENQQASLFA